MIDTYTTTGMAEAVFVDSGAFIALALRQDQHHEAAKQFWNELSFGVRRMTTSSVVGETFTFLRRKVGYGSAYDFLNTVARSEARNTILTIWPDHSWTSQINLILGRYSDQNLSYTDAVSLVACQLQPNIGSIFSFDHHLGVTGLILAPGPRQNKRKT